MEKIVAIETKKAGTHYINLNNKRDLERAKKLRDLNQIIKVRTLTYEEERFLKEIETL